ncbi:putative leucine-rich repeat-containing protein DDB_G0290503 isoform X2 [Palaemon carinicauda]|uniref:putative leucine-rich repeat-containing protein DDB_G0290503 isoform X2 n=1 Tax=Palaemon carinicauda TaxID=392227 RepID=UPI0035B62A88
MSKLFPMFKKKGKGKDDDTNEEEPKRKGKTERVREAFAGSSLSPSKSGKQKKKGKPVKEKKAVNGNVNCHMAEEAVIHQVEDFYVDDDGTVKLGELQEDQSFVDEVLSSVEESFSQEHDRSFSAFDKSYCDDTVEKYCIKRNDEQADGEVILKDNEPEVFSGCDQPGDRSSQESLEVDSKSLVEEKDQESFVTIIGHGQDGENEFGEIEHSVQDSGCLEMSSDQQKDFEGFQNLKEDQLSIDMVVGDNLQAASVGNHCISSDNEEIDIGSISEEKTSYLSACEKASHLEDDESMENVNTDNEADDLQEESIGRGEKQASENVTSSQDSDDDFDSAQEDWDEDDREKPLSLEPSVPSPSLVQEAKNSTMVNSDSTDQDIRKRVSSVYEDATGFVQLDSSLGGESSDFEETRKVRRASGSEKLVRKLSNISAASSDVFNEELDDLLDEELDRLSEEEETPLDNSIRKQGGDVEDTVDRCADKSVAIENVAEILADSSAEDNSKIHGNEQQKSDNLMIENPNGENPTCVIDGDKQQTSTESDEKTTDINMKERSLSGNHLSTSDENSDHIKDSGYYSLPVSPNPGAIIRASGEEERGAKVVDVSFADSEEDGMITPPSEASTVEANSENSRETANSVEEDRKSVVVSESDTPNQCSNECEKLPEKVPTVVDTNLETSSSHQALSQPKHGGNLKVIIPSGSEKNKDEGVTSPNCGSPTKFRHKSPLKEAEEAFSPDPIGERFLEQAVLLGHDEAEARLAQRRAARAEARELRLRELEKQQQDQENEEEKQFAPSFAEPSPRATVAGRTTVGRTAVLNSSRRSSEDSTTDEAALPANIRELRTELKELDEKFRKAMITNAQLDNEKSTLTYEVELIKDKYTELEETHTQLNKEHRRKCTEYEQLRKVSTKLQEEVKILRGMLQERDQLIQEYGLIVVGEEEENGEVPPDPDEFDDMDDLTPRKIAVKKVLLSQEAAELLGKGAAKGSLDVRLKKFGEEKNDLEDEVRRLKLELEEERNKNRRRENGLDYEKAKEQSKALNEYKFRVQKAEAEVLTLQANVARLDALSTRYKTQSEELEKSEEELKLERRKLQRELRDAQSRLEELETTNNHLIRRFDKIKNARSTLLKDLSQDPA